MSTSVIQASKLAAGSKLPIRPSWPRDEPPTAQPSSIATPSISHNDAVRSSHVLALGLSSSASRPAIPSRRCAPPPCGRLIMLVQRPEAQSLRISGAEWFIKSSASLARALATCVRHDSKLHPPASGAKRDNALGKLGWTPNWWLNFLQAHCSSSQISSSGGLATVSA